MSYKELHQAAEDWIVNYLKKKGHKVKKEAAKDHEVLFDVWDKTDNTAYEVLTAKIVRSGHEQDEMILYKIFHYLLICPRLRFYLVSFNHEELKMFHELGLEHWHLWSRGWLSTDVKGTSYHKGKSALQVANRIYRAMIKFVPLKEWCTEGRRKNHPKADVEKEFAKLTKQIGLPKNFLIGMWRDWRLLWVWRLEYVLPMWKKRAEILKKGTAIRLLAKIPKREEKHKKIII